MQTEINFEDYLDAEIMDQAGHFVGTLLCLWKDEYSQAAFLGIKSEYHAKKACIVPATLAEADERRSCVWLSITQEEVKGAPGLDSDERMEPELETRVYHYFQLSRPSKRRRVQMNKAAASRSLHGQAAVSESSSSESDDVPRENRDQF